MPDERSAHRNVHRPALAAADHESEKLTATMPNRGSLDRVTLLRRAVVGATGLLLGSTLAGCGQASTASDRRDENAQEAAAARRKVLIAYFSRAGENYYYGGRRDLKIGNTEVLATMIAKHIAADVYRIRAASPYAHGYEATVARNVREQNADARPRIANPLKSIEDYDVVLLGSPIWNVRPPMIMSTFAESFVFSGKTIHPFVTYASASSAQRCRRTGTSPRARGSARASPYEAKPSDGPTRRCAWLCRINLLR